ncbi:glycosyltransferase family 8 protein [Polychaeton citri CBS 116435]|uniref:Glycosyltransferase family 8 protein n=1 Tax=Polychaeton citri CBS 116435 TaxID=1314669 RepID=A0A9P4UQN5_9PEZI|nr:glycosyltransferase family 8 protein [Polychaeton citri CBS 116435]
MTVTHRFVDKLDGEPDDTTSTPPPPRHAVDSPKVWTTLITNTAYLSGLFTLDYSLKQHGTKYPFVALYTDAFPPEGHAALERRGIAKQRIEYLLPSTPKDFSNDPRFYDCWSKLAPFSLVEYERVVQLDSDMLVRRNMDELMELPLDGTELKGDGDRVFAASHACVCNPLKKPHYPEDWVPENCAFTSQHGTPDKAQTSGAPPTAGLAMPNGGLQVVVPCKEVYDKIVGALGSELKTSGYEFADQSMLGDLFSGKWVALPYIYNALKTLRWEGVHDKIWRDDEVKNVHYILSPKPWDEKVEERGTKDPSHAWWWEVNDKRQKDERERGIDDGY